MLSSIFNEAFQAHLLDIVPAYIAVFDTEQNIVWANQAHLNAADRSLAEIQGQKCHSVWCLDEPCAGCPVQAAIETGKQQQATVSFNKNKRCHPAQSFWLAKATPLKDGAGNIIGAVETAFDITEQKQMENDLRTSEEFYHHLIEHAGDTIVIHDRDGNTLFANKHSSQDLGYSTEELQSINVQHIIADRTKPDLQNLWDSVITGKQRSIETRNRRKDGSTFPVSASLSPINWKNKPAIMAIVRNISEQKHNETNLIKLNSLKEKLLGSGSLREKMQHITDGVVDILDADFARIWIIRPGDRCESGCPHAHVLKGTNACQDRRSCLHLVASSGRYTRLNGTRSRVPFDSSRISKIASGEMDGFISNDVRHDPHIGDNNWAKKVGLSSFAGQRLISQEGESIGVIALVSKREVSAKDEILLQTIASTTSLIIQVTSAQETLTESEKTYKNLYENAQFGSVRVRISDGKVLSCNNKIAQIFGYDSKEDFINEFSFAKNYVDPERRALLLRKLKEHGYVNSFESEFFTKNKQTIWVRFEERLFPDAGYVDSVGIDITESKKAAAERELLRASIEQSGETTVITDTAGTIQYVNRAFEKETGYTRHEAIGENPRILKSGMQDEAFYRELWSTISGGNTFQGRMVNKRRDGTLYTEFATISPVFDTGGKITNYVAVKRNITEQLEMESKLHQAQKMEAIGQLAGGVAHDYNNALSVILGFTQMAMDKVGPTGPLYDDLREVYQAAMHSAEVTRQLLAFARKQTVIPQLLDLNETVGSMLKMLRRLLGEDIKLVWQPMVNLWQVNIDPTQVDQILANLCVNARHAITGVGKVIIETHNIQVDATYCQQHVDLVPGNYVLLMFSDDGSGIDQADREKIFEPFFTTKELGQGTGLGLATVYGIVRQNKGFIYVYSEVGQGTTFKIYLPRRNEEGISHPVTTLSEGALQQGHGETVLIVEDEISILKVIKNILKGLGYTTLEAITTQQAISLAQEHQGKIQLLLTDVVMPEMNGRDLADKLLTFCPGLKVLFMSGYTADIISRQGVLTDGMNFMQKPFTSRDLATKVREELDKNTTL